MKRKRLVLETTKASKTALNNLLAQSQQTFTDWFDTKVCEEVAEYNISHKINLEEEFGLQTLEDLKDSQKLLSRLKNINWAFENDVTTYLSHALHPYPAKFIPQIPAVLVSSLTLPGELVWDPFGGSGTTALEAVLRGRRAISSDANPMAAIIGQAKTTTLSKEDEEAIVALHDKLLLLAGQSDPVKALDESMRSKLKMGTPDIPNISDWFHENAIRELTIIRAFCETLRDGAKNVATAAFSKIVLKSSYQDSETRYTRRKKPVPVGSVLRTYVAELNTIKAKVRQLGNQLKFKKPAFVTADIRSNVIGIKPPAFVAPESVALVVTSPPYPNANDYHLYHRFRLFWLGFDPRKLGHMEIGSHLRHQKEKNGLEIYLDEMRLCLQNCFEALQSGRFAVFVVGDAIYDGKIYDTAERLAEVACAIGFETIGVIQRPLHATKRSFIPAARRLKKESLLLLRKPAKKVQSILKMPPYKLWPYENELRKREIEALMGRSVKRLPNGEMNIAVSPYETDSLRRLTFTHDIETEGCGQLRTWQSVLENGDVKVEQCRKDPKYVTHGIHPYKGKFYPQLAKCLFNIAKLKPGSTVLDPYCGSGTVLLEAQLNGFLARGCDINPLAVEIASAKCGIIMEDPVVVERLLTGFLEKLQKGKNEYSSGDLGSFPSQTHDEILRWFPRKVIGKLSWCLREIDQIPVLTVKSFLRVIFSSIVREVSQQDPEDLRIRRRKTPIVDAPVFEYLEKRLIEQRRRLYEFAMRSDMRPNPSLTARAFLTDSRNSNNLKSVMSDTDGVDAVVTSPPYATALPYIDTNRLSLLLLWGLSAKQRIPLEEQLIGSREISLSNRRGLEEDLQNPSIWKNIPSRLAQKITLEIFKSNNNSEVGFRRMNMASLIYRYFDDMSQSMRSVDRFLNKGADVFMVIGDNRTETAKGEICIKTTDVLCELGDSMKWCLQDRIPITVTKENVRNVHHSISKNTVLWFKKKI